jgi:glycyl-tRNA synthetase beta chain
LSAPHASLLLLEIGCEEIPDGMIVPALEHLKSEVGALARKARLGSPRFEPPLLGTPRRLSLLARDLLSRQEDREVEVTGPRVEAAYDAAGKPTRALEGFARAQGVSLREILRVSTPRGECVAARRREDGRGAPDVVAEAMPGIIASVPFGKTMRWGEGSFRFARPVRWIVCLLDSEVVKFQVAGIDSGRLSRGARFAGSPEIAIPRAGDYLEILRKASVLVDFGERRARIVRLLDEACAALGAGFRREDPPELLDTVTGMVEHPVASRGDFDGSFLELPPAVLSTAMIHHQRFFPVRATEGGLAPHYLAVLNCRSDRKIVETIRRGNEWVLRARLRDAGFFWKEDLKRGLADRIPDLDKVLFETSLGTFRQKVGRVEELSRELCRHLGARGRRLDAEGVAEAARLSKADLTTLMVKEFPELQGIMGGLYARASGRPEGVCRALEQQYLGTGEAGSRSRFATPEGAALAVADRLDTLTGFFLLDRVPTGSRDPYGLRRAATALVQAALDQELDFPLEPLLAKAADLYGAQGVSGSPGFSGKVLSFLEERLRHVCLEARGFRYDAVNAAMAAGCGNLWDAFRRAEALNGVRGHDDFEALALSYRRVKNILAGQQPRRVDESTLAAPEERGLLEALRNVERSADSLLASGGYPEALRLMATLRTPLDRFFDKVLVMDPDPGIRSNRLALLNRISLLFLRVGDFAMMVLEGEPAAEPAKGAHRA